MAATNSTAFNETAVADSTNLAVWSTVPIVAVPVLIAAIFTNGVVLVTFARNRNLWTPFNAYLAHLSTANLLYALILSPLDIVNNLHAAWPLGNAVCTLYLYLIYTLQAAMCNSHVLITVDRIWAVGAPLSYRTHRSIRISACFIAGLWILIHAVILPGLIADALYYRVALDADMCYVNTEPQPGWGKVCQLVMYDTPIFIVALAYPFIWWKRCQREKMKKNAVRDCPISLNQRDSSKQPVPSNIDKSSAVTQPASQPTVPGRKRQAEVNGFMVLTMLTISLVVFWTPLMAYYTVLRFVSIDVPVAEMTTTILFSVESVLDPIWFMVAIKDLRSAALKLVRCEA